MLRHFLLLLLIAGCASPQQQSASYDVLVYGGTSAGVIAAYTAAQMGKKVALVEPGNHLGGMSSGGLGYTDIGNKYVITGIARQFYRRIGAHYGKLEQWTFEPHVAENIFKEYAGHRNITVIYNHRVVNVQKEGTVIKEIELEKSSATGRQNISAKIFVDCSYEGDLMAKAGVSYTIGREANSQYNETYNGVQLMEGHQFPDGIDPYKKSGDKNSGVLWGIDTATLAATGSGDKKVQAYNYRICLTNNSDNKIEIKRPANYDSSRYELLLRLFAKQPAKRKLNDYFIISNMPNNKTDINNRGGFSSDMIGMNYGYPEGTYAQRAAIIKQHEEYTKGLLYFYGHDARVPQELRNEMLQWGYPKDEYTDNGNWSHQLYVREARRMRGAYVMTQHNCESKETVQDTVGLAAYTMDSHNCQRLVVNGMAKNEGNVEIGGFGPYPVAYRSVTPKASECTNLLVPVCLSATHIAYGSIRMEPVFMVIAQTSATSACMAIDKKQNVQDVDIASVNASIRSNPYMDGSTADLLVDNDNSQLVKFTGNWQKLISEQERGYTGNYGPSMLVLKPGKGEGSVTFSTPVRDDGSYNIYYYLPKLPQLAKELNIEIASGGEHKMVNIQTDSVIVEGQTAGEWVHLGRFSLSGKNNVSIKVSGSSAGATLVADAVLLVREK